MFYDEFNNLIDINSIEKPEQDIANEYISENDVVLELGARYGTVSCIINNKLNNRKNQVVVEPDNRVWTALDNNKSLNNGEFHIIKGFISSKKLTLINTEYECWNGYASTSIDDPTSTIPSFTLKEVEEKYNLKFNVLVADCEGFLEIFFDENPDFIKQLRLVIFEADYSEKCNYEKIRNILSENSFKELLNGHQNIWYQKI